MTSCTISYQNYLSYELCDSCKKKMYYCTFLKWIKQILPQLYYCYYRMDIYKLKKKNSSTDNHFRIKIENKIIQYLCLNYSYISV